MQPPTCFEHIFSVLQQQPPASRGAKGLQEEKYGNEGSAADR